MAVALPEAESAPLAGAEHALVPAAKQNVQYGMAEAKLVHSGAASRVSGDLHEGSTQKVPPHWSCDSWLTPGSDQLELLLFELVLVHSKRVHWLPLARIEHIGPLFYFFNIIFSNRFNFDWYGFVFETISLKH